MKKILILLLCAAFLMVPTVHAEPKTYMPLWASEAMCIPDGVVSIEANDFEDTAIEGIVLPMSVKTVAANAFASCTGLKRVCVLGMDTYFGPNALGQASESIEIWAFPGSTAEAYAEAHNYSFVRMYTYSEDLIAYAVSKLGTRYVRGSYDCVLYVRDCYKKALGIILPDTCVAMEHLNESYLVGLQKLNVRRIDKISDLRTGDVICWNNEAVDYCTHVGMYVGAATVNGVSYSSGVFIENSNGAGKVRFNFIYPPRNNGHQELYYTRTFICAWRILP
ncbi:MAG: C40 family peptidase [Clostridia bacterium]|nr:C40 family peptidase [Clostridia bacterium]